MSPALLAALLTQVAIPELVMWLRSLHDQQRPLTDAEVFAKLAADTERGKAIGEAWLAAHPE